MPRIMGIRVSFRRYHHGGGEKSLPYSARRCAAGVARFFSLGLGLVVWQQATRPFLL